MNLTNVIDVKKSQEIFNLTKNNSLQGFAVENSFYLDDVELAVDYFLGESENSVYDFKKYNKEYNNKENFVVLGVLLGGDTFGQIKGKEEIYLNLDTGVNFDEIKFVCVANDLDEFVVKVFNK